MDNLTEEKRKVLYKRAHELLDRVYAILENVFKKCEATMKPKFSKITSDKNPGMKWPDGDAIGGCSSNKEWNDKKPGDTGSI